MIYVNITSTFSSKRKTGIQRVVVTLSEFLSKNINYKFITYDNNNSEFKLISDYECISHAIYDEECKLLTFNFNELKQGDIFFDIDAAWSDGVNRKFLYEILKRKGVKIYNLHYDSVPLVNSAWSHQNTVISYIESFYAKIAYSDYIFSISNFVKKELDDFSRDFIGVSKDGSVIDLGPLPVHEEIDIKKLSQIDKKLTHVLKNNFLLAVGTLEPRKNYSQLLSSFLKIDNGNTNLVIVGRKGWNIDEFVEELTSHPRYNKDIFWLDDVSDEELAFLYKRCRAYITTSLYEGYGLPAMEALSFGAATIVSNGGALPEVVSQFAFVFDLNNNIELEKALTDVIHSDDFYSVLKNKAEDFQYTSWDTVACSIISKIDELENCAADYSFEEKVNQAVYISIDINKFRLSIKSLKDKMKFINEIVVLTKKEYVNDFEAEISNLGFSPHVFCDEDILADIGLSILDHQERNTLLRKELYTQVVIKDNFIAADDDYIALNNISEEYFRSNNVHNCYYYYNSLESWLGSYPNRSSYDRGLLKTAQLLKSYGFHTKAYSSHMPQIINKKLVNEIYGKYLASDKNKGVDEWSVYFNIATFYFPNNFSIKEYRCFSWPGNPSDWPCDVIPVEFDFQNYYDSLENGFNEIVEDPDKILEYKKGLEKVKMTEVQKMNEKVRPICLLVDVNKFTFMQPSFELISGPIHLRRIIVLNKSSEHFDIEMQIIDSGSVKIREEYFNTRNSSWIPLFPPNEPGVYFMECKLLQSGKVISTTNVELSVASN
ncbi:glycosyltransferase family 4 protein [Yersinia bercovieri]|uniref:Glycosyltransferase family 1 protein n=1 Tax=Yersinia bercovieri TaxID=634 RepID=A0A2G4U553_YERBE|nr:glycosyltransferase family 1 protein [Yersinia bercovieri]PHZ28437.1 glycosyltransferase family 1 protein [Yersinia bercovieri]QKJ07789.1 glycosyltransferase family 4 protein [Yersinia bercovieri ATCC 43970]